MGHLNRADDTARARKLQKRAAARPVHVDKYAPTEPTADEVMAAKLAELVAHFNGEERGRRG